MTNRMHINYYIEGERVCSKIGGGFGPAPYYPINNPISFLNGGYEDVQQDLYNMVSRSIECTQYGGSFYISDNLDPVHNEENNFEDLQYFYHPDHLGSSSFITDATGYAVQHLQPACRSFGAGRYLPFGEPKRLLALSSRTPLKIISECEQTFVDQTPATNPYDSRYTFSAKEKDDETQYSYFGARYYDSDLSVWLSVDPMSDERSWISPYNYCQWNPVGRVDPSGALDENPDNFTIYEDSKTVQQEPTKASTNTYTYVKSDGTKVALGTYDKVVNKAGQNMTKAATSENGSSSMYKWVDITSKNWYYPADGFALMLGAIQYFKDNSDKNAGQVQFNQFMSLDGNVHSKHPNWNPSVDIAFYFSNGTTGANTSNSNISSTMNLDLLNSLKSFGVGVNSNGEFEGPIGKPGYHIYSYSNKTKSAFFEGSQGCYDHDDHFHVENFDNSRIIHMYPFFNKPK